MADPVVAALHQWLEAHEAELVEDTRTVLRFASIESEALPNAPYGAENRAALDFVLDKAQQWGMKTTDLEGHLGYAEFGTGDRLVMSLGHLDVVPVGPGWKYPPFGAEIDNGYIYSRGATDDKGPTMAAFYAMRAIKEVVPDIACRLRIAFGCDEESGFGCVARYMETEEAPTFGVAPDSGWPLYHAEKGIADFVVSRSLPKGDMELVSMEGGQRPNIVIDSCKATVKVAASVRAEVEEKVRGKWDANVEAHFEGDLLHITTRGKAAHGSTPFMGDNAATRAFRFMVEIAPFTVREAYEELLLSCHSSGAGIGIAGQDEVSKDLTSNLGIVWVEGGRLQMLFNIRYCVTWTGEHLLSLCQNYLKTLHGDFEVRVDRDSKPLYFPLEHPLVKAVCEVYTAETGDVRAPGVMGGGTYARAIPNCVSIGTSWDGDGLAHETDERVAITSLHRAAKIYAHLFYRLATMPTE
ncbi:MAG: Sapep family Mn(2+)-dependent dipeptidase [Armatimonadetes bacterium]|nr:Sapep family Mn(2+)-dependent dipeptidase [Armatimonadota bacterium]